MHKIKQTQNLFEMYKKYITKVQHDTLYNFYLFRVFMLIKLSYSLYGLFTTNVKYMYLDL